MTKAQTPQPRLLPTGGYVIRYSAPPGPGGRRRQLRVYGGTVKECKDAYTAAMGDPGAARTDARTKLGVYLDQRVAQWALEDDINTRTIDGYRQTFDLYFKPALGHVRLCDLEPKHFRDFAAALRKINRPEADDDKSDLLRRLLAARAQRDGKRISTRPLTDGRIRRVLAVASSALNDLVPEVLPVNPAGKVKVGKVRKQRPLVWTDARVQRWQQTGAVPVQRRQLMVWTAAQAGAFLDSLHTERGRIKPERCYAIFHLAVFSGMRRSELAGLEWADCDLASRRIHVRHAQVERELDTTKSEDSERIIVIDAGTAEVLKAWRKQQLAERLAWGAAWTDSGRVFTREDGSPLCSTWISNRFLTLAERAGLPPVSLHSLRHGAATMQLAAGVPAKVVSENLGHATVAFTMDVYTSVVDQLREDAAERTAALVPLKSKITSLWANSEPNPALTIKNARSPEISGTGVSASQRAEARGFEPRMGANPNRISSAAP